MSMMWIEKHRPKSLDDFIVVIEITKMSSGLDKIS